MLSLLRVLPIVSALVAAVDSWLVRTALDHRPLEPRLFLESWLLWSAFALLALLPARLCLRLVSRLSGADRSASKAGLSFATLLAWTVFPVLAHGRLDAFTSIGQDISGLMRPRPWLEVGAVALALVVGALLLARLLARFSVRGLALSIGLPALLCGAFLPGRLPPSKEAKAAVREADPDSPNLLLLVWDTTRAWSLEPYGYSRETTPRLAELAEESLLFEEARSVSCFTLSSHLSMLTGTYPSHHGARMTRMFVDPDRTPSIARLLRDAGYRTGGFVGTDVLRAGSGIVDGFEVYSDRVDPAVCDTRAWKLVHDVQSVLAKFFAAFENNGRPHWIQDFQRPADGVLEEARKWVAQDDPRPWFCFVNLYDVHWPYLPENETRQRWVRPYAGGVDGFLFRSDNYQREAGVRRGSKLDFADRWHLMELYDAELAELDRKVGGFLETLELESGRTAVLLTSDHGEAFGEGGRYEHDDILEPQVRVPLLLRLPHEAGERPAAGRRQTAASGVDVAATFLALAGVEIPEHMRGLDLRHLDSELPRQILVEDRDKLSPEENHYVLYEGRWKLQVHGIGHEARIELYDLEEDLLGLHDVGTRYPRIRDRLATALEVLRCGWGGGLEDVETEGIRFDDGLEALGYTGEENE